MTQPDPDNATLSEGELKLLAKLEERTIQIDENVDSVVEATKKNRENISENERKIKRNATILGGYSAGLMMILMWSADKISRIL